MTAQVQYSEAAPVRAKVPRYERLFFELAGPAIKNEPLHFICDGREYRFGSAQEATVVRIDDADVFRRILTEGNLGLAEAYMDKQVEIVRGTLEDFLTSLSRADLENVIRSDPRSMLKLSGIYLRNFLRGRYGNVQSHYDFGLDLFEAFVDESMAYSCGYAASPGDSLAQLQINKFDRICRKLRLKPGDRLLDIGCGFGGLLIHAAKHFGARGTGITISRDQHRRGQARVVDNGLAGQVDILFASHANLPPGKFDKVVSVGMVEHLTTRDYPVYFGNIKRALVPGGMGLVHGIGCTSYKNPHDPFIQKYIFPGSRTPKLSELAGHLERHDLAIHDVENIGRHYGPTARRWKENLQKNYSKLDPKKYDDRLKRLWEYYFALGVAAATVSSCSVWQVLFANGRELDMPYQRV